MKTDNSEKNMDVDSDEFVERWRGELRKIEFSPKPYLPADAAWFYHSAGFPSYFSIEGFRKLEFHSKCAPLAETWQQIQGDEWRMPLAWNVFWKIGDAEYGRAGAMCAWLCIEELTGRIVTIDPEEDNEPVRTLSSSPVHLAMAMLLYQEAFGSDEALILDDDLRDGLLHLSTNNVFREANSLRFWFPHGLLPGDDAGIENDTPFELRTA